MQKLITMNSKEHYEIILCETNLPRENVTIDEAIERMNLFIERNTSDKNLENITEVEKITRRYQLERFRELLLWMENIEDKSIRIQTLIYEKRMIFYNERMDYIERMDKEIERNSKK